MALARQYFQTQRSGAVPLLTGTGRHERRPPAPRLAIAGVAFAASLALVVLGLYVMLTTK
jgi:hypothetical protein